MIYTIQTKKERMPQKVSASRIDSTVASEQNLEIWSMADGKPVTDRQRKILRNIARQEVLNDSTLSGALGRLSNDMIGAKGPMLRITDQPDLSADFMGWSKAINLAEFLRAAKVTKTVDGDCFIQLTSDDLIENEVKLRPMIIDTASVDQIIYNQQRHPIAYVISITFGETIEIDASNVLHWYKGVDGRGWCEFTPALKIISNLRRYTEATLAAAETAANIAMVIERSYPSGYQPPNGHYEGLNPDDDGDVVPLAKNMATFLPVGSKLSQLKPEQPTAAFGDVKDRFLQELGFNLQMPRAIITNSAANYNYSSARIDFQSYHLSIDVSREDMSIEVLNRLFYAYLAEKSLVDGIAYDVPPSAITWSYQPHEHVDVDKVSKAAVRDIQFGLLSHEEYYDRRGLVWEEQKAKIAAGLGMSITDYEQLLQQNLRTRPIEEPTEPEDE